MVDRTAALRFAEGDRLRVHDALALLPRQDHRSADAARRYVSERRRTVGQPGVGDARAATHGAGTPVLARLEHRGPAPAGASRGNTRGCRFGGAVMTQELFEVADGDGL